jgi:hypothetical protein
LNQHLSRPRFTKPEELVAWLGAVQAQDFAGAKWSLGLRLKGVTDADIERVFNAGKILRTHLLRPTWHFVASEDIRWLLALTASRVHQANSYMYRKLGMDSAVFKRSNDALAKALAGGRQLTREELREVLDRAGVATEGQFRMSYLLMRAELDGVVCSGGRRGKQFTYALLDDRAPRVNLSTRDEALAELARRYFRSRGPSSVHDLANWSGLTVAEARRGLEAVKSGFNNEVIGGQSLWFSAPEQHAKRTTPAAYLLSIYDEFVSGYKAHRAAVPDEIAARLKSLGNALTHIMLVSDQLVGVWKPVLEKDTVLVRASPFASLSRTETQALAKAARKYGEFLALKAKLSMEFNSEAAPPAAGAGAVPG